MYEFLPVQLYQISAVDIWIEQVFMKQVGSLFSNNLLKDEH